MISCDWANFGGLDYCEICTPCVGGYRDGLVARKSDLDLANWTVDAAGQITAIPLAGAALWRRFRPVPNENTTVTAVGARDSEFAALKYPINIQGQFFQVDNAFARSIDQIQNCCNLVFLLENNCCEVMVFGLDYNSNCGSTPAFKEILSGIRLTGDNLDLGNKDTNVSDILTFSGMSTSRELYLDTSTIDWAALVSGVLVTPTCV